METERNKIPCIGFEIKNNHPIAEVRASGKNKAYTPTKGIHRHTHHEILIIKKGGGSHIIDFNTIPVEDNQVFFLRPGQVHQFNPDKNAEFYFIAMDTDEIQLNSTVKLSQFEYFQSFYSPGYMVFDEVESLIQIAKKIQQSIEQQPKRINQRMIISSLTVVFLVQLQQKFLEKINIEQQKPMNSDLVSDFNKLIDNAEDTKRFVKDYAQLLFVTANYLNETVKKETGQPASYWIYQHLILESKRLITQSSLSIKEIAQQLKFVNAAHFSRFFKTHQGLTPREFKEKLKFLS